MFEKPIARVEALLKGMVFDCHACGQCVLGQTGMICPMTCPKGLRNGPCGGTLNGECEVYPDKPCVWVRIRDRTGEGSLECPVLLPSTDARLWNTSSCLNALSGADAATRQPLDYLDLGTQRTRHPVLTLSRLERRLKSGAFVRTCEVRAPRTPDFDAFGAEVAPIRRYFDAVNVTSYLNGRPTLPSPVVAAKLVELGVEPISQSTCRDHTKTSFIAELLQNEFSHIHNTLCLTGDSYRGTPKIRQVFDMDSSLMLYEARYLREVGDVFFTGERVDPRPRPFLGAAINPFSTPMETTIGRLKQKAAAGADFIQTQVIFDVATFERFMRLVVQERIDDDLFILAGIPVVTSTRALEVIPRIPGVHLPPAIMERLHSASDIRAEGLALARETLAHVSAIPGVAGVHLMLFGTDRSALPELVEGLKDQRFPVEPGATHAQPSTEAHPCPSTH